MMPDDFTARQIIRCRALSRAASSAGNINVQVLINPGDAPAVRPDLLEATSDFEICSDGVSDTYDMWSVGGRSLIRPNMPMHEAVSVLVDSYTKQKRRVMKRRMLLSDDQLDEYFATQHNGHLGRAG
jgi:hypothetical protein